MVAPSGRADSTRGRRTGCRVCQETTTSREASAPNCRCRPATRGVVTGSPTGGATGSGVKAVGASAGVAAAAGAPAAAPDTAAAPVYGRRTQPERAEETPAAEAGLEQGAVGLGGGGHRRDRSVGHGADSGPGAGPVGQPQLNARRNPGGPPGLVRAPGARRCAAGRPRCRTAPGAGPRTPTPQIGRRPGLPGAARGPGLAGRPDVRGPIRFDEVVAVQPPDRVSGRRRRCRDRAGRGRWPGTTGRGRSSGSPSRSRRTRWRPAGDAAT